MELPFSIASFLKNILLCSRKIIDFHHHGYSLSSKGNPSFTTLHFFLSRLDGFSDFHNEKLFEFSMRCCFFFFIRPPCKRKNTNSRDDWQKNVASVNGSLSFHTLYRQTKVALFEQSDGYVSSQQKRRLCLYCVWNLFEHTILVYFSRQHAC